MQLEAPPPPDSPPGYAYVTVVTPGSGATGRVLQYSVAADGGLTPMSNAMVSAGNTPMAVAVDPEGRHAYVVNVGDGSISQFSIGASGDLTPLSPAQIANPGMLTLGAASAAITVDPSGQFVYVTNMADATVSQFTIGSDGSLAPMTPVSIPVGVGPVMVTIDPGSHYAYVANSGVGVQPVAGSVSQFTIAAGGGLVPMSPATISAGAYPRAVTIGPGATYAFVASDCNGSQCVGEVFQYVIGTGGALSPTGSVIQTGGHGNTRSAPMGRSSQEIPRASP
jgi:6-phosphogluconolactonase (cycloisomerase 2 family)